MLQKGIEEKWNGNKQENWITGKISEETGGVANLIREKRQRMFKNMGWRHESIQAITFE